MLLSSIETEGLHFVVSPTYASFENQKKKVNDIDLINGVESGLSVRGNVGSDLLNATKF